MHPFPPPPYDRATLMQAIYWQTGASVVAVVLLVVWTLFGQKRAKANDTILWGLSGVFVTLFFTPPTWERPELWAYRDAIMGLHWLAILIGSVICWIRLKRQGEARFIPRSVCVLLPFAVINATIPPAVISTREGARRTQCKYNMHNVGLAFHNYHDDHDDTFPLQAAGDPPASWRVKLLPYMDGELLHDDYDFAAAWNSDANLPIARKPVAILLCPSVPEPYEKRDGIYFTSYALAVGPDAMWTADGPREPADGQSNTLMLVEACGQQIVWSEPRDIDLTTTPVGINLPGAVEGRSRGLLSSFHRDAANVLIADGAVTSLSADIDPKVLEALLSADGGEEVGDF